MTANQYVIGRWYSPILRAIGCFPAKENSKKIPHGIDASLAFAKKGSLMIFPEGARSTVYKIERLRSGAAVIAHESGLPVIPIYIQKQPGKLFRSFTLVRGEPFDASKMDIEQMMDRVWKLKSKIDKQ